MIQEYAFQLPQRVISGPGSVEKLPEQIEKLGKRRAFVMTGKTLAKMTNLAGRIESLLGEAHVGTFSGCTQHVLSRSVDAAAAHAREVKADVLIAFGGGSPIDAVKHVAHRLMGEGSREDLPQIAIPTTLSAGEFTSIGGITDEETRVKSGIRDPRILPSIVIHDAELSVKTPTQLWASTGIKALDHAIEALWSPRAHPVTDTLAQEAIRRLHTHLLDSLDPQNLVARQECLMAAWMSIFGVRNVGMRLTHPLGHQIGARWDVPHGVTSCIVLPETMRFFAEKTGSAQRRIAEAFGISTEGLDDAGAALKAADAVEALIQSLDVPMRLSETGAVHEELPEVARAVAHELSISRSPDADTATEEVLLGLLERIW